MERIGLTFAEYAELKVRPRVGADAAFGHAAEMTLAEMFPMTLVAASSHLRSRGYDCRPAMVEVPVCDGVLTPAEPDAWSQADHLASSRPPRRLFNHSPLTFPATAAKVSSIHNLNLV